MHVCMVLVGKLCGFTAPPAQQNYGHRVWDVHMHGLVKCRGVSINGTKVCITRNLTLYKYEERTYKGRGMQV